MKFSDQIRRIKLLYSFYNLFQYKKLKHNKTAFRKYGIDKKYFSNISYKALQKLGSELPDSEKPWLDIENSAQKLPANKEFKALDDKTQEAILHWSNNGYAILKGFLSSEEVDIINA